MTSQDSRNIPGVVHPARGQTRRNPPRHVPPWAWAVPAVILVFLARYVAAVAGGWYAFTDWNGLTPTAAFTGLENFRQIFTDEAARGALLNTVKFAACFVVLTNLVGLFLAVALNGHLQTRLLLRTAFFAPVVMSQLATAFIWRFLFDYSGPVNGVLGALGLGALKKTWLADPTWSFWAVVVVLVWQFSGLAMVILLAGLQGIPQEVEEAAKIDGASSWQRLRRITLPLLAPALAISTQLSVISGLGIFDTVMALTNGGPLGATETLATQVYKQTFVFGRYGYGTALALLLTVLIIAAALIQQLTTRAAERRTA